MPCYDPRGNEPEIRYKTVYESGISPTELKVQMDKVAWAEAALCAIINELEDRGVAVEIMQSASRNGLIGLVEFYDEHKQTDFSRMTKEIHKYSVHEQNMIRKILGNNEGRELQSV